MQENCFSLVPHTHALDDLIEKTKTYIRGAKSPATIRAYRTDFEDFKRFCLEHDLSFLPASPTTVALFISSRPVISLRQRSPGVLLPSPRPTRPPVAAIRQRRAATLW